LSARAEVAFAPELQTLGEKLTVPIPDRVRILRELSGDLHALTERLVADGVTPDEARRRATQALVPDEQTLRALERLHEPLYVRLTRRIDPSRLRTLERRGLVAATVFMVGASGLALASVDVVNAVSRFQWPVMIVGGLTFAAGLAKAFEIWIKGDHSRIRRGLSVILFLSLSQLAIVTLGVMVDLYVAASTVESTPALAEATMFGWIFASSLLMATGLLFALAGTLAWFVIDHWVTHIESAHREVLGLTGPGSYKNGDA